MLESWLGGIGLRDWLVGEIGAIGARVERYGESGDLELLAEYVNKYIYVEAQPSNSKRRGEF